MAIYLSDLKIDLTIKRYEKEPRDRVELDKPYPPDEMKLKEQRQFNDMTLREALQKLVELVF